MEENTNVENKNKRSNELYKKLFKNIFIAILVMIYFIFINLGSFNIAHEIFLTDIKVFSIIILGISIIIFEKAYEKDSSELALHGIETLILACHTLSVIHITNIFNFDFKYYILTSSYIFAIYYVFKDILIYTKENRKYLESLSDIPDIVKKVEPSKKEAKKKNKSEENLNEEKQIDVKEIKDKKTKTKTKASTKKTTTKKKTTTSKTKKTDETTKSEKTKRKTTKTKKENVEENKDIENKPKKRGRPKKKVE